LARVSLPNEFHLASEKNPWRVREAWPEAFKPQSYAILARENFFRVCRLLCAAARRLHNFATMFSIFPAALGSRRAK
jgi:hypothetical protein